MRAPFFVAGRQGPSWTAADAQRGENLRGAGLMVLSMAAFVCNDAAIKFVTQTLPLAEGVLLRGLGVTAVLLVLARRDGGVCWPTDPRDQRMLVLRAFAEVGSTMLYLLALQRMALGNLSAIMQSLPLLVMLAAAALFRERLGARRISAVAVGLAGVLLILRPGTSAFDVWSLVALGSVGMIVVREIATRRFSPAVRSTTVALSAAVAVTLSAPLMPSDGPWRWPTGPELAGLSIAILCLSVGYQTAVASMRVGEMGFVSPFRYTSLLFAVLLGMAVFGEWPDRWTWAGGALVVGAGLYSIWRETRLARERR